MLLFALLYFNPRSFIKNTVLTEKNKTWGDVFLFRKPKVNVLHKSPLWELKAKQAKLLGNDEGLAELSQGLEEEVDGVAKVTEVDTGYVIETDDGKFWAEKISAGYVCGESFYATPHPVQTEVLDIPGCILVLVIGCLFALTLIVPNFMNYLTYISVANDKTKKFKAFILVSLATGAIVLIFITFVAADVVLEYLHAPHMTKVFKDKCFVIGDYINKWAAAGHPEEAEKIYREILAVQTQALNKKLTKRMVKGKIPNNTRNWKLLQAGLLATVDEPFIQQASMTSLGNGKFRFHVPCGAAVTSMSSKDGVPQISYKWISDITYVNEEVLMTFIDEAKAHFDVWCSGDGKSQMNLENWKKDNGFNYALETESFGWPVWCTTCKWSRQYGKCLFGFKYSKAGSWVLRKVVEAENGGYLQRGEADPSTGVILYKPLDEKEAKTLNLNTTNTYADRKGGWIENVSHTIMQEGWKGWDIENRAEALGSWQSSMIPSQVEGDVISVLKGRIIFKKKKRSTFCNFNIDRTATARVTNDTCFSEFDLEVDPGTNWVETGVPCAKVYAGQVGDKISVAVDGDQTTDQYCSVTLTVGETEKVYYIRPGEPWVGYHLDAWRCRNIDNGTRGEDCSNFREPEKVNYEKFSGLFDTIVTSEIRIVPDSPLLGTLGNKIMQALTLLIFGAVVVLLVVIAVKLLLPFILKHCVKSRKASAPSAVGVEEVKNRDCDL